MDKNKRFLNQLLSGPRGEISSKRSMAIILVLSGIVYLFINKDSTGAGVLIGAGCALLGVSAITKS